MDETPRLALPLLYAGQAQKEQFHNEALMVADALIGATVVDRQDTPPPAPLAGQCWVIGTTPTGSWAGHADQLAIWTAGGWRFQPLPAGFVVWSEAAGLPLRRTEAGWVAGELTAVSLRIAGRQVVGSQASAITDPAGGTTIDVEARNVITAILATMRQHGLIAET